MIKQQAVFVTPTTVESLTVESLTIESLTVITLTVRIAYSDALAGLSSVSFSATVYNIMLTGDEYTCTFTGLA
jgi:hypothetical protein